MDLDGYLRFVLALVFVLALIAVMAAVARHFGIGHAIARKPKGDRRLGIVEVMAVDAKRRLVLIRRDRVEHLILLGANSETVIETVIEPPPDSFDAVLERATHET